MKEPLVTIVIPCFNREHWLKEEINSLKNQSYENIEILLVDGNSTDNSVRLAEKLGARVLKMKRKGFHEAEFRYAGAINAKGNIILQADSDVHFPKNYIEEMTKPIREGKADATSLSLLKIHKERKGILADFWEIKRLSSHVMKQRGGYEAKGALGMKQSIVKKVGHYDPNLEVGADVDYGRRIKKAGFKIETVFTTWFNHADPDRWVPFLRRVFWGSFKGHEFMEKWDKNYGLKKIQTFGLNLLFFFGLVSIPLYSYFGYLSLIPILASFFLESILPLLTHNQYRLMPWLALREKKHFLFFTLPFVMYLYMRANILGWTVGLFRIRRKP